MEYIFITYKPIVDIQILNDKYNGYGHTQRDESKPLQLLQLTKNINLYKSDSDSENDMSYKYKYNSNDDDDILLSLKSYKEKSSSLKSDINKDKLSSSK